MTYASVIQEASPETAAGLGALLIALGSFRAQLIDTAGTFGMPHGGFLVNFILISVATFGMLTPNQSYGPTLLKGVSVYSLINGIVATVSPAKFFSMWGNKNADDPLSICMTRAYGFANVGWNIMVLCLLAGVDPLRAFGYANLVFVALLCNQTFVTKDVAKLGFDIAPQIAWILFGSVVSSLILM